MRQRHLLYASTMLMDGAVAGLSFAVSRRAAELGATAGQLGWLGAMWIGTYALAALVTGPLSDRLGPRNVARTGCALASLLALACAFTTQFGLLLLLTGAFGIAMAGFWPSIIAWLSEGTQDSAVLNARLSRFSMAWNLGLLIGFAQTGFIFRHWPRGAFFVAGGLIAINVVLLSLPARADADDTAKIPSTPIPKGRGFRKTAWLANFTMSLTGGGVGALFPQLATALGVNADVHGGLLALGRAAAMVPFVALPALMFWRTRLWPLWVAQIVAAAGILILGFANTTAWFAVAFFVGGIVGGYTYQASVVFTMEEVSEKGKGGGLHEAVNGLGMAVGPLLAGWAGNQGSLRTPYFACAGMLVILVIAQMILVLWRRRATVSA